MESMVLKNGLKKAKTPISRGLPTGRYLQSLYLDNISYFQKSQQVIHII